MVYIWLNHSRKQQNLVFMLCSCHSHNSPKFSGENKTALWARRAEINSIHATLEPPPGILFTDPVHWCVDAPLCCTGRLQSPIDLTQEMHNDQGSDLGALLFSQGYYETISGDLVNNGHAGTDKKKQFKTWLFCFEYNCVWFVLLKVQFSPLDMCQQRKHHLTVSGGPLGKNEYTFAQFHVHWGSTKASGSEHRMSGRSWVEHASFWIGCLSNKTFGRGWKPADTKKEYPRDIFWNSATSHKLL